MTEITKPIMSDSADTEELPVVEATETVEEPPVEFVESVPAPEPPPPPAPAPVSSSPYPDSGTTKRQPWSQLDYIPSNWSLKIADGNNIEARSATGNFFYGTREEFNQKLRG
jgi:hypothetical protein